MGVHPALRTLSYSRLSSHDSCPRSFWHQYVDKTPPDGYERVEGWMGSLVHKTLEWALRETLDKRVPDPVAVLEHYEASWDAEHGDHVLITKNGYDAQHYRRVGRKCLSDHLDAEWPFLRHHPVAVEERVEYPVDLGAGTSRFIGYVDRIDHDPDGLVRIVDYKTGAWVPDMSDPAEARQLALYWNALRPRFPSAKKSVLVWHYLQSGQTLRVDPTPDIVLQAVQWVKATGRALQRKLAADASKEAFATKPSALCKWCSFGYACDDNPFKGSAPKPSSRAGPNARLGDFGETEVSDPH